MAKDTVRPREHDDSRFGQPSIVLADIESKAGDRRGADRGAITWHSHQPDTAYTRGYVDPQGMDSSAFIPSHGPDDPNVTPSLNSSDPTQSAYHSLVLFDGNWSLPRPVVAQANAPLALANNTMFESDPTDTTLYTNDSRSDGVDIDIPQNLRQNTVVSNPLEDSPLSPQTNYFDPIHPMFNGRALRLKYTLLMRVGATSQAKRSYDPWVEGMTSSGHNHEIPGMNLVAVETDLLPPGTIVSIPGYNEGRPVPVVDRDDWIKSHDVDLLLLLLTDEQTLEWADKRLPVVVWEYAD